MANTDIFKIPGKKCEPAQKVEVSYTKEIEIQTEVTQEADESDDVFDI